MQAAVWLACGLGGAPGTGLGAAASAPEVLADPPAAAAPAPQPVPPAAAAPAPQPVPPAAAAPASQPAPPTAATPTPQPLRRWVTVPRLLGRLGPADIGLVVNRLDPDSVAIGAHYAAARGLEPWQVLEVDLPRQPVLAPAQFEALREAIERHFGPRTQALALAWSEPYAVGCNSLPGALALGFDAGLCENSCGRSRPSGWFNGASIRPFAVPGIRPSMLLAAPSRAEAIALIERGVAADGTLAAPAAAPGAARALLLDGPDAARQVRRWLYPPGDGGRLPWSAAVHWERAEAERALPGAERLLVAITGSRTVPLMPPPHWLPGGLGDHLTSFGGDLAGSHGQDTALAWIASGATASHGSVSEPCNHWQKFPHPQVLLGHYLQGATAIEAYWRSVAWPQQSLFVGEPLAAPFAPAPARAHRPAAAPAVPALPTAPVEPAAPASAGSAAEPG